MKINSCEFPDGLLYDDDGLVWVRRQSERDVVLGITSIHAAVAGPLTKVTSKAVGLEYARGKTIATLESGKFFGPIRTPVAGFLVAVNEEGLRNPKLLSNAPYAEGWIARLRPSSSEDFAGLKTVADARNRLAAQIAALGVHCFAAFPDHELVEIGTECAAVLTKLDELMAHLRVGDVVHLVSDDWTAPVEMENWAMRTGQGLLESRKEANLYHFLVRKVA